jgi:DNA-binding SARP family transcriptional activator/tetratricopeptide (TPR) repeat protein
MARDDVRIQLLGEFVVHIGGRRIAEADWPTRRARELVALLALSPGRRLPRDVVVEHVWPHLDARAGGANLRKAAHHARRVLGEADAIVSRGGVIELLPAHEVSTDVDAFLAAAEAALDNGDPGRCAGAADLAATGDVLPSAPYETWTQEPRRRIRARRVELLRAAGDHERLLEIEATDEVAARALMEAALADGLRHTAIRVYEQVRLALARELGAAPAPATRAVYERCTAGARLREEPFVGRADELAAATDVLRETVSARDARALIVRGESGIGKSALCHELTRRAQEDGWHAITATATTSGPPLGPIATCVEQLLVRSGGLAADLPEQTRRTLAHLTPLVEAPAAPAGPLTRHQVIAALRRILAAGSAPVVLCVEDAHLADEASADVLHQLVTGGSGGTALVVVLAVRAEWLRTSLPRGVVELGRAGGTLRLDLGPMGDVELTELVAGHVPDQEAVGRIVQAASGSPLFALELARAAAATGAPPRSPGTAIAERFSNLPEAQLEQLAPMALAEEALDLGSVLALTGLGEDEAFALLDAALEAGVLIVADARYRFRHELVRRALVDDLPPHRRVTLQREAAGRLANAGAAPHRVAHHLLAAGDGPAAVPWLLDAARAAAGIGAYADARRQIERLLQQTPGHVDGLILRAEVLDALGDPAAPDAYGAAAAAVGAPDDQDLLARQAQAQLKASRVVEAVATLEGVEPHSTAGRLAQALTLSAAAAVGVYGDAKAASDLAEEAHRLALELGDPGAVLDATWASALAAHARGELPARLREYLRQTRALPEIATRVFDGQLCVTERMLYGGLPNDEIIAFADGLAAEAQRLGAARGEAFAVTLRGEAALLAGDLERADRDFTDGARLHGRIGALAGEALSLLGRGQVAIAQGRPEHAIPFLSDALLIARESEVGHHTFDRIYGALVDAAPHPQAGVALVTEAESAIQGPAETCPTCRIAFTVPATIAAARAGDVERAHRYRDVVRTAIAHIALPPAWHAAAEEAYGWVAEAEGRGEAARRHFAVAAEGFARWGQPLDAQRCRARLAAVAAP